MSPDAQQRIDLKKLDIAITALSRIGLEHCDGKCAEIAHEAMRDMGRCNTEHVREREE